MKRLPHLKYMVFAAVLSFAALFAFKADLLAGTLGSVLLPTARRQADTLEADTTAIADTAASAYTDSSAVLEADATVADPLAEVVTSFAPAAERTASAALPNLERMPVLPPQKIDTETLWLARVIYSETKRPREQELVAWVVRNRVETAFRGKRSYQHVVLDPMQFSAFNPGTRTRQFYSALTPASRTPGWQNALSIAAFVRDASPFLRPFSIYTRHFYSEQSMVGRRYPTWAAGLKPVTPRRPFEIEARRFRFYENIG